MLDQRNLRKQKAFNEINTTLIHQDLEKVFILYFAAGLECALIFLQKQRERERVLSKVSLLFCSMQTLEKPSCLFTKLHLAAGSEELRHLPYALLFWFVFPIAEPICNY